MILQILLITFTSSLCSLLANPPADQKPTKPNIIFIMADDLGYGDISCYGSKTINTPHTDKLASTGVKCTDYHSNGAVCSPTRAALMTGRYQQRSGISGVITAKSHRHTGLALKEWTMAEAMKQQGYATAMFGKWHLGYDPKYNPIQQGFDEFRGFVSGNIDYHNHIGQEGYVDWWNQDKAKEDTGYATDLISGYATDFIRRKKDTPFLLILNHGAPHYPLQGRKSPGFRVVGKAKSNSKIENPKATYKEMIEVMDEGIGQIVAELEKQNIRKNTLIIFTSDNGPASNGSAGILRGKKGLVFEGGHRVPGIFNWPAQLPAGKECDTPILSMDFLPTFVAIGGGKVDEARKLDGINIIGTLKGNKLQPRPLFWQHKKSTAVRDGNWKLVIHKKTELFDLSKDLSEKNDLSKQHPEQVQRLKTMINNWEKSVTKDAAGKSKSPN